MLLSAFFTGKINEPSYLENALNLTREFCMTILQKKFTFIFLLQIIIQTLMCQTSCIFKTKWLIYFSSKKMVSEAKVLRPILFTVPCFFFTNAENWLIDHNLLWKSFFLTIMLVHIHKLYLYMLNTSIIYKYNVT